LSRGAFTFGFELLMSERRDFSDAREAILYAHEGTGDLSAPFISAFPVAGASLSVMTGAGGQSTISSSDRVADRLDELQFDLGEGPCWTAMSDRAPVLCPDLRTDGAEWPAFADAVLSDDITEDVTSLFAFPLKVGSLDIGAVDLYGTDNRPLEPSEVAEASTLADLAAWQILRRILQDHDELYDAGSLGFARREVHQATGMMIVQLGISPEDAELLLRAHAFSTGRAVREVANDIVERRLDFTPRRPPAGRA
jgi:hypothetical protein